MDIPEPSYSKGLIATSEMIKNAISHTLAIVNEMSPVSESIREYMEQNSIFTSRHILDSPLMSTVEERNRAIAKIIPSSVLAIQNGLDLPSSNVANQIAASIPKTVLPKIGFAFKPVVFDLYKFDFRINVLQQEVSKNLFVLLEKTSQTVHIENNDTAADIDETFFKSSVNTTDENDPTDDIAEIKKLLWQIYERQEEQMDQTFEKYIQERKQNDNSNNSYQISILAFIGGITTVLSLITSPKEIYDFLVWIDQIISFLLNK